MKKITFLTKQVWQFTLAMFLVLTLSFSSSAQEMLLNGGFETWTDATTPESWTKAENTEKETTIFHTGTASAKHTGGTKDISQTVTGIVAGEDYTITIWYKVIEADGDDARIWSNWVAAGTNMSENATELKGPNGNYLDNNGGAWTKYTVTLTAPATADAFYFEVRTYSGAVVYWDDFSFYHGPFVTAPTLTATPTTLTGFTYQVEDGPSAEKEFTVEATDLTENVTVTGSTNYEVSLTSATGFAAMVTIPMADLSSAVTVYTRLKTGLAVADYNNENIIIATTGATDATVTCSGEVTAIPGTPIITTSVAELTGFTYLYLDGPSETQTFNVTGVDLLSDINISPQEFFEVSLTDGAGFVAASPTTIPQVGGAVTDVPVYVRLKAGLPVGNYDLEKITVSSQDAASETLDATGVVENVISNVAVTETAPYYAGETVTVTWDAVNIDKVNIEVYIPVSMDTLLLHDNIDASLGTQQVIISEDATYSAEYIVMVSYTTDTATRASSDKIEIRGVANTLADLKANHNTGDIVKFTGKTIVTWAQSFRGQKYLQQDGTAILIDDDNKVISEAYVIGDEMGGFDGKLGEYGNMIQFVPQTDPGVALSNDNIVKPMELTVANLNADIAKYRGVLVTLSETMFTVANSDTVFGNGKTYELVQDQDNFGFRTTFYGVDYIETEIPSGKVKITGIINSTSDGDYITSRDASEIIPPAANVTFQILDSKQVPVSGAEVLFMTKTLTTDASGEVEFTSVSATTDEAYTVTKTGYADYPGTVTVSGANVKEVVTLTTVGIEAKKALVNNIYPNPTNGELTIKLSSDVSEASLEVIDMTGRTVEKRALYQVESTIDLTGNKAGIYFIRIASDNEQYLGKVILK